MSNLKEPTFAAAPREYSLVVITEVAPPADTALVVIASVLAVISLLVARRSDDSICTAGDSDRFLNP